MDRWRVQGWMSRKMFVIGRLRSTLVTRTDSLINKWVIITTQLRLITRERQIKSAPINNRLNTPNTIWVNKWAI